MRNLPILKLPLLTLEKIFKDVDPADIFHFSLCSTNSRQTVQATRPQCPMISWCLDANANGIMIETGKPKYIFDGQNERRVETGERVSKLMINVFDGPSRKIRPIQSPEASRLQFGFDRFTAQGALYHREPGSVQVDFQVGDSESREALFKLLITHIQSIFICDTYHLGYWADPQDPGLLSLFTPIKNFCFEHKLELLPKILYFLRLERGTIENLHFQSIERVWNFPRITFNELLPFRSMDLGYAPWFSFRNISTLDFVALRVEEPNLTPSDINRILRMWQSGGYHQLEAIVFYTWDPENPDTALQLNKEVIMEGLNVVEVRNNGETQEIQRADGMKARVIVCKRNFGFYVRHPGFSRDKDWKCTRWTFEASSSSSLLDYLNAE